MKLADLEAELVRATDRGWHRVGTLAEAQGLLLLCPCGDGHSLVVWFADRGVPSSCEPAPRWVVSGTCLADLTLTPSIDAKCWHGHVHGGAVV